MRQSDSPHAGPWPVVLLLLGVLLALASPLAAAQQPLVLNTDYQSPNSRPDGTGIEDRIVREAFKRIGVAVRLVQLPSERALQNVDQGIDDGNYMRIAGLSAAYPNLIMVPEPASEFPFTAFTRDPALRVFAWSDLRGRTVGSVTGWKLVEQRLADVVNPTQVRDEEALFALLGKGRVEVVIAGLHTGQEIIRRNGYKGMHPLLPPLERRDMFIYLHKRHTGLVPRLVKALRQMRQEGVTQRLTKSALSGNAP